MAQEILKDKSNRCVYATIGASSHSDEDRMINDYYATDPNALERLLKFEVFHEKVWEPACGGGHLSRVLESHGYSVRNSDIVDRMGGGVEILDFIEGDTGGVGRRHHHQPSILLRTGVCREGSLYSRRWVKGGNVPKAYFPGREEAEGNVRKVSTEESVCI